MRLVRSLLRRHDTKRPRTIWIAGGVRLFRGHGKARNRRRPPDHEQCQFGHVYEVQRNLRLKASMHTRVCSRSFFSPQKKTELPVLWCSMHHNAINGDGYLGYSPLLTKRKAAGVTLAFNAAVPDCNLILRSRIT